MSQHVHPRVHPLPEHESLDQLRGDCARMAPHWTAAPAPVSFPRSAPVPGGVRVPARSARLLEGMSDYGD
jgi:hypothetical protein